jgi:hypothetical protein
MKVEFSRQIFEKAQISNSIKTRPVGTELLQTEMTKLIVAFRNFSKAPLNLSWCHFIHHESNVDRPWSNPDFSFLFYV